MALIHNDMIRGLNSIYLQAPHVQTKDQRSFCSYIIRWHQLLHVHHSAEEAEVFPDVEAMAGERGIMEANVDQHHAFTDGLGAFVAYVQEILGRKQRYDGDKAVKLIDAFGTVLVQHLHDEIPTLLSLRKYGSEKMAGLQ